MTTPITIRRALSAVAAAALGLSLTACSALSPDSSSSADSRTAGGAAGALPVAVSFYPIQYLTEAIGGDHVSVTSLTPADQEPHDYDLSGKEVTSTLEGASLVAYVEGFQPSLDKAVTQVNGPTVLDLSSKVDLKHHVAWRTRRSTPMNPPMRARTRRPTTTRTPSTLISGSTRFA